MHTKSQANLGLVLEMLDDILGTGALRATAEAAFAGLAKVGKVYYNKELKGIAAAAGLPLGQVVVLQIAYEVFAACTSIVVDMDGAHAPGGTPGEVRHQWVAQFARPSF